MKHKHFDTKTTNTLLKNAQLGDPDAFAALYANTVFEQHRYAWCYLQETLAVQDALQQTYTKAREQLHHCPSNGRFSAWLSKINYEVCFELLKKQLFAQHPELDDLAVDSLLNERIRLGRELLKSTEKNNRNMPTAQGASVKNSSYRGLSMDEAALILDRTCYEADLPSTTIPLETLFTASLQQQKKPRFAYIVSGLVLLFLLLLPIFFIAPDFSLTLENSPENSDGGRMIYTVSIDGKIPPMRSIRADMDGTELRVYKNDRNTYTIVPEQNGILTVTVTGWNLQYSTQSVVINSLDTEPPKITSYTIEEDLIYLNLSDNLSGIDYASIEATDERGNVMKPDSSFKDIAQVVFKLPQQTLTVHIEDVNGNALDVTINVQE